VGCHRSKVKPTLSSKCCVVYLTLSRTTESQLHRELASGTSFPIGFKNGTNSSVDIALDAMNASSHPHVFLGVTDTGLASIVKTAGNKDVHVILRGGTSGPNYSVEHVSAAAAAIAKKRPERAPSVMIDCSRTFCHISARCLASCSPHLP
jgi:3-deoxy-7-phosphoheptulonate synthase